MNIIEIDLSYLWKLIDGATDKSESRSKLTSYYKTIFTTSITTFSNNFRYSNMMSLLNQRNKKRKENNKL